jgi:hypothetical protein
MEAVVLRLQRLLPCDLDSPARPFLNCQVIAEFNLGYFSPEFFRKRAGDGHNSSLRLNVLSGIPNHLDVSFATSVMRQPGIAIALRDSDDGSVIR